MWYAYLPNLLILSKIGGFCGSALLDARFENYVKTIVGVDQYYRISKANRIQMMDYFDCCIKRPFCYEDTGDVSVKLLGVQDDPLMGISDERITIPW